MVAPGFNQPLCFNPALVYLIAGFLIGLSLRYYMDRTRGNKRGTAAMATSTTKKRRR